MDAVAQEQEFVDQAYRRLDELKASYARKLEEIRLHGLRGNPEQRFQRDSFAADCEDNLARLSHVEHQLVLGRLDSETGHVDHIGRIGLRDEDRNVLVLDWRAPQASAFYQATAVNPLGMVRRRHIQTRMRTVVSVEDELLTSDAEATKGLTLTGEGALLAALGRARDGKMGDIVSTIQAEQDRIIRESTDGILVVQGGPGTGKTAVALHRAAYLLYAERHRLSRSGVLIIGPSESFLNYISQVLPSLGESDVVSSTIDDLIPGVTPTLTDSDDVADIKGLPVWEQILERAVTYLRRPLAEPVKIRINSFTVTLKPAMVSRAQRRALHTELPHNEAWKTYATSLIDDLMDEYMRVSETQQEEWLRADIASNPDVRKYINLHWLPTTPTWLLEHLFAHPDLLAQLAPELTNDQREALYRPRTGAVSAADIPLVDEIAERVGILEFATQHSTDVEEYAQATLEGMGLGGGIVDAKMLASRQFDDRRMSLSDRAVHDRSWVYGHVVVDEAQELSPMAWRMLARRCPSRSMTIVGDLDQYRAGAPSRGWAGLLGPLAPHIREEVLTISYRTPRSVLEKADDVMTERGITLLHPATPVRDVDNALRYATLEDALVAEREFLDAEYGEGLGKIAVIADEPPVIDDPRVVSMTPRESKGLEFDSVILAGPISAPGDLYVAMTRPTQHLVLTEDL